MIDLVTDARIRILERRIADLEGQVQSLREEVEKQHTVMQVNVSPSGNDELLKAIERGNSKLTDRFSQNKPQTANVASHVLKHIEEHPEIAEPVIPVELKNL